MRWLVDGLDSPAWDEGPYFQSDNAPKHLEAAQRLHEKHGLATRLVSASEAADLVPGLDPTGIRTATFNPFPNHLSQLTIVE